VTRVGGGFISRGTRSQPPCRVPPQDITAAVGNPWRDNNPADIRVGTVLFIDRGTNATISLRPGPHPRALSLARCARSGSRLIGTINVLSATDPTQRVTTFNRPVNVGTVKSKTFSWLCRIELPAERQGRHCQRFGVEGRR
jgi:hypothetical protein